MFLKSEEESAARNLTTITTPTTTTTTTTASSSDDQQTNNSQGFFQRNIEFDFLNCDTQKLCNFSLAFLTFVLFSAIVFLILGLLVFNLYIKYRNLSYRFRKAKSSKTAKPNHTPNVSINNLNNSKTKVHVTDESQLRSSEQAKNKTTYDSSTASRIFKNGSVLLKKTIIGQAHKLNPDNVDLELRRAIERRKMDISVRY